MSKAFCIYEPIHGRTPNCEDDCENCAYWYREDEKGNNRRGTIKGEFRRMYGYDQNHTCKECRFCVKHTANRSYYKCERMGETRSAATDIRLKDFACRLFEPEVRSAE